MSRQRWVGNIIHCFSEHSNKGITNKMLKYQVEMKERKYFFPCNSYCMSAGFCGCQNLSWVQKHVNGKKIQVGCCKEETELLVSISEDMEGCFPAHLPSVPCKDWSR